MVTGKNNLYKWLLQYRSGFHPVVPFNSDTEKVIAMDFTENNKALQKTNIADIKIFCQYIADVLKKAGATYGAGGYGELRSMYSGSDLFGTAKDEEPRRFHIGFDIWGNAGTKVYAPCKGTVHSFAFNNNPGDYGATIILQHHFDAFSFCTLYGHLSVSDLTNLKEGDEIQQGQVFAHFGTPQENGHWPPHLHFQIIEDIGNYAGDYPGVCKYSEREKYLSNCPDPDLILQIEKFICS